MLAPGIISRPLYPGLTADTFATNHALLRTGKARVRPRSLRWPPLPAQSSHHHPLRRDSPAGSTRLSYPSAPCGVLRRPAHDNFRHKDARAILSGAKMGTRIYATARSPSLASLFSLPDIWVDPRRSSRNIEVRCGARSVRALQGLHRQVVTKGQVCALRNEPPRARPLFQALSSVHGCRSRRRGTRRASRNQG